MLINNAPTVLAALTAATAPAHLAAVAFSLAPADAYVVSDVLDGLASHARQDHDGGLWRARLVARPGDMCQLADIVAEAVCHTSDSASLDGLAVYLDGLADQVVSESFAA